MRKIEMDIQFKIELFFALLIGIAVCCAAFSNLLFAPNELYPYTGDALGHLTKVHYIAESFLRGEWPSWFPYWYNGAAVWQYYPPLSYFLMAPIQMLTNNIMLTYKIFCFLMLFIGGMGVWYFCRKYIGHWCGLLGLIVYSLQPFLLLTLFEEGALAQGPIIAITPWFLLIVLSLAKNNTSKQFVVCSLLTGLMILSHAMHAFMVCLCIMIVLLIFIPLKKISFTGYIFTGLSIAFGGILTAFWWLTGVTHFENPDIPYILNEAIMIWTANVSWFLENDNTGFLYFSISVTIGYLLALVIYLYSASIKKDSVKDNYFILSAILLTCITIIFSFGLNLPLFKYIPFSENLVPGRILSLTSVVAAICCAYLVFAIFSFIKGKNILVKIFITLMCLLIIAAIIIDLNPYQTTYQVISDSSFEQMTSEVDIQGIEFGMGRYYWLDPVDCSEMFFSYMNNLNISYGWNVEGTPHNKTLWGQNVGVASENEAYIAKNIAFWNVRYFLASPQYKNIIDILNNQYNFEIQGARDYTEFYVSDKPSSYYLLDNRNAIVMGKGSPGVAIEFPYLVKGHSDSLSDYSFEELYNYKLVYLCEPSIESEEEQKYLNEIVSLLTDKGVTVIIEPAETEKYTILGVTAKNIKLENDPKIIKKADSILETNTENIMLEEELNYARALFGLDESIYVLAQNNGRLVNDIIGTKNIGKGKVIFLGGHISQYLKAVHVLNLGVPDDNEYPDCEHHVKILLEDIFKASEINTNFWPEIFPVKSQHWNHKGGTFNYSSKKSNQVTVSVTYSPRWKAFVEGMPLNIGQKENLIVLDLPEGEHEVSLVYGITKYVLWGYVLTLIGGILLLLLYLYYNIILGYFSRFIAFLKEWLRN